MTSGGIGTRRHAVCAIAVMVQELFAEGLAANVAGQGSSLERHGMNNEFVARNKEWRNVGERKDHEA